MNFLINALFNARNFLVTALFNVLKTILVKLASEKFLTWLFLWVAESIAESTKTTKDDEFVKKAREVING